MIQFSKFRLLAVFLFITAVNTITYSNNVVISNIGLVNDSTIKFDISWDNSWRTASPPYNHDAVWIFIKKKDCASSQWSHVDVNPNANLHSAGNPLEVYIDGRDENNTAKGVFIRRKEIGYGNITTTTVNLRLNFPSVGEYDYKVSGIEMVQIPEGSYYLGGSNSVGSIAAVQNYVNATTFESFKVTSENQLTKDTHIKQLNNTYPILTVPAAFPKGFKEIYCMKYEISQAQFVEFTNCLTSDQAANHVFANAATNALAITGVWPNRISPTPHRAMTGLTWKNFAAYLDWAALRPMSELEFEKICRGPLDPVKNEYAWGNNTLHETLTITNTGTETESVTNPNGIGVANLGASTLGQPLRCGFAASPSTNRQTAGASYYGVMEMTGNATEIVVNIQVAQGTSYIPNIGDGEVSNLPYPGFANVVGWPSIAGSLSEFPGIGLKGGGYQSSLVTATRKTQGEISNRYLIATDPATTNTCNGGRGVR